MGLWGHNACTKEQSYRDMRYLCAQRTNPMGIDAQIEDQSYEHTMHVLIQSYGTLHVATHTYVHVRALCQVRRTIYMGNKEELL